ncbi:MAG: KamA family radical SAM protein, partial [Candidatus Aminicenantes bacterium]
MDEKTKQKLLRILDTLPPLKEIMISETSLEEKRELIRELLNSRLKATFDDNPDLPALKWVLARDTIWVFRNLLSHRSEKLAGFSFLEFLDDLLNADRKTDGPKPTPDFFAELDHIIRGISGQADVYPETAPAFSKHEGVKAARLRSVDLSRMAKKVEKYNHRYPSGLDDHVKRLRYRNKLRILRYFNATEYEWSSWKWQTRHIIRDPETLGALIKLTEKQKEAVKLAVKHKIPFGITPYYLSLMDYEPSRGYDRAIRAQVIPSLHYVNTLKRYKDHDAHSMDFMLERDTSPIEGITRRYPQIVILKPVLTCPQICVYCQRNWEIEDVYSHQAILPKSRLQKALDWID